MTVRVDDVLKVSRTADRMTRAVRGVVTGKWGRRMLRRTGLRGAKLREVRRLLASAQTVA